MPGRKGQWLMRQSLPKSSTFITLKAGKSAHERFLRTASPATLGWIKSRTVHYAQAIIVQQYLSSELSGRAVVEKASAEGEEHKKHVPVVPEAPRQTSAASYGDRIDDDDQEREKKNKVSGIPFKLFVALRWMERPILPHVYNHQPWNRLHLVQSSN